jgi:anti-sigma factor RsiW
MIMRHKLRWKLQHWLEGRVPGLLTCRDFETFVDAYVDGELGPVARVTVDFHMKTCPICQRYLEAYRRVRDLAVDAVSAEDAAALDAVPEDLVGAILAARAAEIDRPGA